MGSDSRLELSNGPVPDAAAPTLGVWRATAICGNDITSSCLYVSGLALIYAGPWGPVALLMVSAVLYLFRRIYAEVGSALPLNGGTYNVLLNTISKRKAALAATLTLLSYMATAVISASEAMHYANVLFENIDVPVATILLLAFFALLNIIGLSESAGVALFIFAFHIITLVALCGLGLFALTQDTAVLVENLSLSPADWPIPRPGVGLALLFGFSAAMLGISGFESSANYIEDQKPGVFPATLRNMWIAITVFNPLICFLVLSLIPLAEVSTHKEALLSEMGAVAATAVPSVFGIAWSSAARVWVSVDAVLVLSGAVLTSYVGVIGLVKRMSLDLCLPQVLLKTNAWRGSNHWIILGFFFLCVSILKITKGKIETLAGVYTLSFLAVMGLFAIGNSLLANRYPELPRSERAPRPFIVIAILSIVVALVGNVILDPAYVRVFALYFVLAASFVMLVLLRSSIFRGLLTVLNKFDGRSAPILALTAYASQKLHAQGCRYIAFVGFSGSEEEIVNAAQYILDNEPIRHFKYVWFEQPGSDLSRVRSAVRTVDMAFPKLRIDFMAVEGNLVPQSIHHLVEGLGIPNNYVFVAAQTKIAQNNLAQLGGVRLLAV